MWNKSDQGIKLFFTFFFLTAKVWCVNSKVVSAGFFHWLIDPLEFGFITLMSVQTEEQMGGFSVTHLDLKRIVYFFNNEKIKEKKCPIEVCNI